MVASRNVYNMRRYKRKRSGFDSVKYFILEKRFLLIGIAAAAVVIVLFFAPGILTNQGKDDTAQVEPSTTPVETVEPTPTATATPAPSATATPEPSPSTSVAASSRVLKYTKPNMQGDDVWALQEKLGLKADGYYGQSTADAVREFQQNNGLPADGIAGPTTLQKLGLQ